MDLSGRRWIIHVCLISWLPAHRRVSFSDFFLFCLFCQRLCDWRCSCFRLLLSNFNDWTDPGETVARLMPKTRSYWSDGGTHKSEGGNFRPIASHTTLAEAGGGLMSISFSLSFWPKACGDPDAWVSLFVIVVCCLLLYTTSKLSSSSSPSLFFSSLALIYTQTRIYYRKREREGVGSALSCYSHRTDRKWKAAKSGGARARTHIPSTETLPEQKRGSSQWKLHSPKESGQLGITRRRTSFEWRWWRNLIFWPREQRADWCGWVKRGGENKTEGKSFWADRRMNIAKETDEPRGGGGVGRRRRFFCFLARSERVGAGGETQKASSAESERKRKRRGEELVLLCRVDWMNSKWGGVRGGTKTDGPEVAETGRAKERSRVGRSIRAGRRQKTRLLRITFTSHRRNFYRIARPAEVLQQWYRLPSSSSSSRCSCLQTQQQKHKLNSVPISRYCCCCSFLVRAVGNAASDICRKSCRSSSDRRRPELNVHLLLWPVCINISCHVRFWFLITYSDLPSGH